MSSFYLFCCLFCLPAIPSIYPKCQSNRILYFILSNVNDKMWEKSTRETITQRESVSEGGRLMCLCELKRLYASSSHIEWKTKRGFRNWKRRLFNINIIKATSSKNGVNFLLCRLYTQQCTTTPIDDKKKTINTLSMCIRCFCGIPICVMSVVLAFFSSLPVFFSLLVSLCKAMVVMHIIITITIDRPSTYRTPSIWWKKFRYSILFRQSPWNIYMCEPHTHSYWIKCKRSHATSEKRREKRIMLAFKWDREKLKIYRCQKWRQAYKTKLT